MILFLNRERKEAEPVLTRGVQVNRQAVFGDHLQVLVFW